MDAPKYQQPPLDPSFGLLSMQAQQQNMAAMQTDAGAEKSRLLARFGTLASGSVTTGGPGGPGGIGDFMGMAQRGSNPLGFKLA